MYHKLPPWWIFIISVEPLLFQQMIGLIPGVLAFYQTTLYAAPHSKRNFDHKSYFELTMATYGAYNLNLPEIISYIKMPPPQWKDSRYKNATIS